ncbi:MAG TPA: glycerate kinase [Solirubrobacterales bacterium]|nr:glycerate kinase [Solirubrobacterales bacterium]
MERPRPTTFLVAPDSFKGTFSAVEVAAAIASGIEAGGTRADRCPVADGGEGTVDALLAALGGERVVARAHDPLGRPIEAAYAVTADGTAIVETAAASGLGLVDPADRDPEAASTAGTGELIADAIDRGATRVLVAVGGSATTDGGAGAIGAIEAAGGLRDAKLDVLCDVRTPFERAAEVFGPQKGADREAVIRLTRRLEGLAGRLPRDPRGVAMTGCAGGLSGGLWARYGADLVPGAAFVLDAVDFDRRASVAEAVITGEGRIDSQTLEGKLVGEIAERCRVAGRPLHAVVGTDELGPEGASAAGLASVTAATTLEAIEAAAGELAERLA